jgi:nucleoside-diphosphate-sugar epimerase
MKSEYNMPINIGSEEMVSINQLANIIMNIANKPLQIKHISGPQGVRGRNSDNILIRKVLNWEPKYTLKAGLTKTYEWIHNQLSI